MLFSSDHTNCSVMIGATSLDSYLRIIGLLSSAAAALWGLSVFSSFVYTVDSDVDFLSRWVVGVVNILSIFLNFPAVIFGDLVNTDWNCLFRMLTFWFDSEWRSPFS